MKDGHHEEKVSFWRVQTFPDYEVAEHG